MRVLFDTNILLDVIEKREPHFQSSKAALLTCEQRGDEMFLAWHSLSNAFYILRKKVGLEKAAQALLEALTCMSVASVGQAEAVRAFGLGFSDLEDAMQAVSAEAAGASYVVTHDVAGFARSPVPALSPGEFLAKFQIN